MQKQGFAKTLFAEMHRHSPWTKESKASGPFWPTVDRFLQRGRISYLEYAFVHRLLRGFPEIEEEAALFLCHLVLAAKEGHLCIEIEAGTLRPSVDRLWCGEESIPLHPEEVDRLTRSILRGAEKVPSENVSSIYEKPFALTEHFVFRENGRFYLQKFRSFETLFLSGLFDFLSSFPFPAVCPIGLEKTLNESGMQDRLQPRQIDAVRSGCLKSLTLIDGGPGTGKTYTAGHLIETFWNCLDPLEKADCRITAVAPTGKAASNLQKSLNARTARLPDFPSVRSKTLHSLLEINRRTPFGNRTRLSADLIVADESSMIDIKTAALLFESLKPGSRLILLGDEHQLPSVEAGSIFADLVRSIREHPISNASCINLSVCLRTELQSSIEFAESVKSGSSEKVLTRLNDGSSPGIERLTFSSDRFKARREFIDYALKYFPTTLDFRDVSETVLQTFNRFRILSPLRKGPFGVDELNRSIRDAIHRKLPSKGYSVVPIMIATNDYRRELFNGETGVLIRKLHSVDFDEEDYALFPSGGCPSGVRVVPASLLPKYELAYCLSVHKSQGSEFDRVLLALPEGSEKFGREVLYTGLTRARKQVDLYVSDAVLSETIRGKNERLSGIYERIGKLRNGERIDANVIKDIGELP